MYAKKIDNNQSIVISEFKKYGCSVFPAFRIGGGFPDLVIGVGGYTGLVEIKNGRSGRLTPSQKKFIEGFKGRVYIVDNVNQVPDIINKIVSGE